MLAAYQVVSQELHYERRVFVAFLAQGVELWNINQYVITICMIRELTSDRIVKCLLCKMAGLIWGVKDLVVKDREVQGESQTDGVGRSEISGGNLSCGFVCLQ